MTQDKRNYIQAVSSKTLLELIQNLLINSGIDSLIRISDNQIEATIEAGVAGTFKNVYCMLAEPLSKNYSGMNPLSEEIDRRFKNGCSKFYLVSNHSISTGFRVKLEQTTIHKNSIVYWDTDDLLKNIEKNYPDYWRHNDQSLITYEKYFENRINESFEIKKLVEYKAAYQKLLSIFIEPNIFLKTDDKQSTKKAFTKVNLERVLIENERLMVLHGDPGTGKTRLLYEIGRLFIRQNSVIAGKRHLPIFIDSVNLRDAISQDGKINMSEMISGLITKDYFDGRDLKVIIKEYQIILLVDSIDEFEDKYQKDIVSKLEEMMDEGAIVFIGSRSNILDELFKSSLRLCCMNPA